METIYNRQELLHKHFFSVTYSELSVMLYLIPSGTSSLFDNSFASFGHAVDVGADTAGTETQLMYG